MKRPDIFYNVRREEAASLVRVIVEGPARLPGGGGAPAQSLPSTCEQILTYSKS